MTKVITIYDAKTNLSKYVKQAKAGTPVYIGSYGQEEVVLLPAQPKKAKIKFGTAAGKLRFQAASEENQLDEDVQELFYGPDWDSKA